MNVFFSIANCRGHPSVLVLDPSHGLTPSWFGDKPIFLECVELSCPFCHCPTVFLEKEPVEGIIGGTIWWCRSCKHMNWAWPAN